MTPWTIARRASYPWNSRGKNTGEGCYSPPGDLSDLGIEPEALTLQADSFPLSQLEAQGQVVLKS